MDTVSLICTLVYVLVYICILYTSVYFLPTFLTPLMRRNVRRFALLVYFYYKSILYVSIINIFTTILCSVLCLDVQCYPMDCSLPGFSVHEDSSGKNTGVGCHALFQGIFPTQVSNLGLLHCRWIICHLSHQGSPTILKWIPYLFSRGSSWLRNRTRVSLTLPNLLYVLTSTSPVFYFVPIYFVQSYTLIS